jgi:hypothetical protein
MSNITTTFGNLPSVANLSSALKKLQTIAPTGAILMKFDKTGTWVFGADSDEVEDGSQWAVNPYSFSHGYIAWGDGAPVGERMASMTDDLPDPGPVPPQADEKGWQMQVAIQLKCMTGQDAGMEVRYATTSVGGRRAVQALGLAIAEQIDKSPTDPVAVVTLQTSSYKHSSYGKVYVPVFEIVRFMGLEGPSEASAAIPPAAEASEDPPRRRRARA